MRSKLNILLVKIDILCLFRDYQCVKRSWINLDEDYNISDDHTKHLQFNEMLVE